MARVSYPLRWYIKMTMPPGTVDMDGTGAEDAELNDRALHTWVELPGQPDHKDKVAAERWMKQGGAPRTGDYRLDRVMVEDVTVTVEVKPTVTFG